MGQKAHVTADREVGATYMRTSSKGLGTGWFLGASWFPRFQNRDFHLRGEGLSTGTPDLRHPAPGHLPRRRRGRNGFGVFVVIG